MNIVYNKNTLYIENCLSDNIDIERFYSHLSKKEFHNSFGIISYPHYISRFSYKLNESLEIVELSKQEKDELKQFGRVLSQEDRILNDLKPKYKEVEKAKQTIDLIDMVEDVLRGHYE